jgi:hypothetical protein
VIGPKFCDLDLREFARAGLNVTFRNRPDGVYFLHGPDFAFLDDVGEPISAGGELGEVDNRRRRRLITFGRLVAVAFRYALAPWLAR